MVNYLAHYAREWRHIHPELTGYDLQAMKIPRGPIYGRILKALRAARLDGTITTRAGEEELARAMAASADAAP